MISKVYDLLPKEAIMIRTEVFMNEQGFKNEFDSIDENSFHLVLFENDRPIGTCRFFSEDDHYAIGRLAVLKSERGKGYAKQLIVEAQEAIKERGGKNISIHAQKRLVGMYTHLGFKSEGIEDLDEGVPHLWMSKTV